MTIDPTLDWTLELVRLKTVYGGRFDPRALSARRKPTGTEILLMLDEHGFVARAESHEGCPRGLLEEAAALFPACLRRAA